MRKNLFILCVLLLSTLIAAKDPMFKSYREEDDYDCKRHKNEGICTNHDGHFTCKCLFHEKPAYILSEWIPEEQVRRFSQKCEEIKLPFHEDSCQVLPGNPNDLDDWELVCPNHGFVQTWGGFAPRKNSYHDRIWYQCCNVQCPSWNCQWSPTTQVHSPFELPIQGVYVQGGRGRYVHEKKASEWSLLLCTCDFSGQRDEL